ncbi:MAG: alpha-galactosidase [Armatimonadota bacterium]
MRTTMVILSIITLATASSTCAMSPKQGEMLTAHRWALSAFEGIKSKETPKPGLAVQADWDRVQQGARYGSPMRIGSVKYERGIYCHAPGRIRVYLPGPGREFSATMGADDALQYDVRDYPSGPLWPELIFSISAGDKVIFKSEPVKGPGLPGIPVKADLGGVREFVLEVNGTKYNEWGEADWADARVTLEDGSIVYLDELPMLGQMAPGDNTQPPFSFTYSNKHSSKFLKDWKLDRVSRKLDSNRTERTLTYTDPDTGLAVRCVSIEYHDYPTVEWTVYFKNTGKKDTPLLKDIRSLDMRMQTGPGSDFMLHHSLGSSCRADDYRPMETILLPGMKKFFAPVTGFSTDVEMPYFNIDSGAGEGIIAVIGWPGQWSAQFIRDEGVGLHILGGQETTRFKLHPGEEVRTPLTVLQFWQGDYISSQNVWRRWYISHNLPKPGGKPITPVMPATTYELQFWPQPVKTSEESQKEFIDRYEKAGIKLDWWWIDFGWHEGTWQPVKERFPNGMLPVTDYVRSKGMRTNVWFAPEQAPLGGKPEWMLPAKGQEPLNRGTDVLNLDLGNPDAWQWVVNMIDDRLTDNGIDCFRLDGGWGPLPNWKANDTKDRQGITENRYVTGFLALYDELQRRHPQLIIDNCCRGGRRNDLETMRRSIPLWRTDYLNTAASQQCQTYGISLWLPMSGIENSGSTPYEFRSRMTPSNLLGHNVRDSVDLQFLKRVTDQWHEVSANYFGDYYPLTSYTPLEGEWMAWQFDRPEAGEGFIQVFRRSGDPDSSARSDMMSFRLRGVDPNAQYSVKNLDIEGSVQMSGRELMEKGIQVQSAAPPAAWIFTYRKLTL